MEFQSPGLDWVSTTRQKILRLVITVGMAAAAGLIRVVALVLAMSGMEVHGQQVSAVRPEDRAPHELYRRIPDVLDLTLDDQANNEGTDKEEEDLSQATGGRVLKAIRQ